MVYAIAVFAPLIGALISGLLGKFIGDRAAMGASVLGMVIAAICGPYAFFALVPDGEPATVDLSTWIEAGKFHVDWALRYDTLSAAMVAMVSFVSMLIHVYSIGYMAHDARPRYRFFAYLSLFSFAMLMLVTADNLAQLFFGWEGVGLCSYLLIGYYYEKPAAREAAKKAFLVNRIGDFGFSIGIMLSFLAFGTVSYFGQGVGTHTGLLELATGTHLGGFQTYALKWIPFLLMIGAFGKSAQFPLYVWLPDAMEGPSPVSALIHAATMVTAGVYMIARCGTLFVGSAPAMSTVAAIGCFTAIFAATIALRQFDLKKVFAYSTISQLGFMFVAVGCFAPVAGVFHLVTHAFFKALLFLSAGVVMHAMGGELDMRKMSGLKRVLPITNIVILIGCAALSGFPFTSGFFSKDQIVGAAFARNWLLGAILLFTAFLTAYYTFRLYFQVFQGPLVLPATPAPDHAHDSHDHGHEPKDPGHEEHHNHEPRIMWIPLAILAVGALFGGLFNYHDALADFLSHSPSFDLAWKLTADPGRYAAGFGHIDASAPETSEQGLMILSGLISLTGIGLAYWLHLLERARAERIAAGLEPLTGLIEHKFLVDEIYQAAIVEPLRRLGGYFYAIDRFVVDGVVGLIAFIPQFFGFLLRITTERGYLQGYAATMLLGLALILILIFLK
jgi:NADH-quinone oxidoreductase subunit L